MTKLKGMEYFGYFNDTSNNPAYDPMHDAPCLICHKPWSVDNVVTPSLMIPNDNKSYFYRVHKTCYKSLSEEEKTLYDSSLIDNLMRNR